MKKLILTYGLIAGIISCSMYIGMMLIGNADVENIKHGMIYGYTLMILAFSMIFVCTRIIRDKQQGGVISFGKAFRIGLYITLIASTVYVGVWLIDFYTFNQDFMVKYSAKTIENLRATGASAAEIAEKTKSMEALTKMYNNPLFIALMTYIEIVPVGILMSLINAFVMKRKKPQGAAQVASVK